MQSFMKRAATLAAGVVAAVAAAQPAQAALRINEMMINAPGGSDVGRQFIEIIGAPGESVNNVFIVQLNNEGVSLGTVNAIINLSSAGTVGTNGLLLVRDAATAMSPAPAPATTVLVDTVNYPDFDNDHHTYLLVTGFTGALTNDLDTNDDGTLETTPWTTLLDALSLKNDTLEPDIATGLGGTLVSGNGVYTPDMLFRDPNNADRVVGCDALGSGLVAYTIDSGNLSDAEFASVSLSPGNVNQGFDVDKALAFNEVMMNVPGADNGKEFIELLGNDSESTNGVSILVVDNNAPGFGTILNVVNLSGAVAAGTNGLLLVRDSATVLTPAPNAGTNTLVNDFSPDLDDNSVTYLLVTGFSGSVGNDLDTNDDATLETLPWTTLLDALFVSDTTGETSIATGLGGLSTTAQTFTPFGVFLTPIGNTLVTGVITGTSPGPFILDSLQVDPAEYAGESMTPGNSNPTVFVGAPAMEVEFFESTNTK